MADGRKNNGGHSTKGVAGRKPKAKEVELIERLSPFEDKALEALRKGVEGGEYQYVKMYFEYRFGKPKETINLNHNELPKPPAKHFHNFDKD